MFANTHGEEIYELDSVVAYDHVSFDYPAVAYPDYEIREIPIFLYKMFPYDFAFSTYFKKNILIIEDGDFDTTIEDVAYDLSRAYGMYFMNYYFDLYRDGVVENDSYFMLRYENEHEIYYKEDDLLDYNKYFGNKERYLVEIAADDYVYLMGSPNTKKTCEFLDTYDTLVLDYEDEDAFYEYFETTAGYQFNQTPIANIALPLPNEVQGLAQLMYGAIGQEPPEYQDYSQAEEITIEVKRRTKYGKPYYTVTWNKPWEEEGVLYTLVGYDAADQMQGGIKTISVDEKAQAIIGGAVYSSSTGYYWDDEDNWKREGFVRLRVIVTFGDGTAAVSPPLDWSFE